MCRNMVDIQSAIAEIGRGNKKGRRKKKRQGKDIMSASATQGGHNKRHKRLVKDRSRVFDVKRCGRHLSVAGKLFQTFGRATDWSCVHTGSGAATQRKTTHGAARCLACCKRIGWQWHNFFISAVLRHFVGQALRNVCYSDVSRRHFLNKVAILRTFS